MPKDAFVPELGKYFCCYKFLFEDHNEEKGWFFIKDDAYDVYLLGDETEETRGSARPEHELEDVPFLYLDRTRKIRVERGTKLTGIYVVHSHFFKERKITFPKGYADIYGIKICREWVERDPVSVAPCLFPMNLYDDASPVVDTEHGACNVNLMHAQYAYRDQVAQQFTKQLFTWDCTFA